MCVGGLHWPAVPAARAFDTALDAAEAADVPPPSRGRGALPRLPLARATGQLAHRGRSGVEDNPRTASLGPLHPAVVGIIAILG